MSVPPAFCGESWSGLACLSAPLATVFQLMSGLAKFLWRRRLAILAVSLVLVLAAVLSYNTRRQRPDPRLAAIRKAGYPVTLAELDGWYPRVPDAQNAALIYTNAFARMRYVSTDGTNRDRRQLADIKLPHRGQTFRAEDQAELAAMIASNAPALRLLYSAHNRTNCRYPLDLKLGFDVPLPHLAGVRDAVRLLSMEAVWHAANGEQEQAVHSLQTAARVANSINAEPTLISQLVQFSSWGIIASHLEHVLNATDFSAAQLAGLQTALANAEHPAGAAQALAGELASGLAVFDDPKMRPRIFGDGLANGGGGTELRYRAVISALLASGIFAKDRNYYLDALTTNVNAAALPYPARFTTARKTVAAFNTTPSRFYIFSRMLLPALAKFYVRDADHTTRVRVAQTVLGIERYRAAHANALPESLEQLVPDYLPQVPDDPCSGGKLRFKKLDRGYVVYGTGSDGRDDGGLEKQTGGTVANFDITFTIER